MANTYKPAGSRSEGRSASLRTAGPSAPGGKFRKPFPRRKVCRFCADKVDYIDFKNVNLLRSFISERGKMTSSRITGVCSPHQRQLTHAIKLARNIALLPFSVV